MIIILAIHISILVDAILDFFSKTGNINFLLYNCFVYVITLYSFQIYRLYLNLSGSNKCPYHRNLYSRTYILEW